MRVTRIGYAILRVQPDTYPEPQLNTGSGRGRVLHKQPLSDYRQSEVRKRMDAVYELLPVAGGSFQMRARMSALNEKYIET